MSGRPQRAQPARGADERSSPAGGALALWLVSAFLAGFVAAHYLLQRLLADRGDDAVIAGGLVVL